MKKKLTQLFSIASFLGSSGTDRLIDRGFLYCLPCGVEREVSENGDVEECPNCQNPQYNLYDDPYGKESPESEKEKSGT